MKTSSLCLSFWLGCTLLAAARPASDLYSDYQKAIRDTPGLRCSYHVWVVSENKGKAFDGALLLEGPRKFAWTRSGEGHETTMVSDGVSSLTSEGQRNPVNSDINNAVRDGLVDWGVASMFAPQDQVGLLPPSHLSSSVTTAGNRAVDVLQFDRSLRGDESQAYHVTLWLDATSHLPVRRVIDGAGVDAWYDHDGKRAQAGGSGVHYTPVQVSEWYDEFAPVTSFPAATFVVPPGSR